MTIRSNQDLRPLPSDEEILAAIREIVDASYFGNGATAAEIAGKLGIQSARRLGRGAVKGSWTGYMSSALRIAPRLRSMYKRGLLRPGYAVRDDDRYRARWLAVDRETAKKVAADGIAKERRRKGIS